MSEILYEQPIYVVRIGDAIYQFSAGTSRGEAEAWIEAARQRVEAAIEEAVN